MRSTVATAALAHVPALLLLSSAAWSGTFQSPMADGAVLVGHLALVAVAALAGDGWRDPLGLGRRGWWLLGLALVAVVLSWRLSPTPRAGRLGICLLPLFVLIPRAVARCWATPDALRRGIQSVAVAVAAVAASALVDRAHAGDPRTAMPLGHHNLLGLWLVALLPLAAAASLAWRPPSRPRSVASFRAWFGFSMGLAALGLGLAALVGTRSLASAVGLSSVVAVLLLWHGGRWGVLGVLGVGGALVATQGERLRDVLLVADASLATRLGYWRAGVEGFQARPWFGWGPGSTPWTLTRFLRPVPGDHPRDEVVGDLHSLPLQLAYELGAMGCGALLLVGALFVARRAQTSVRVPRVRTAALAGLVASAIASLGGLPLPVLALPTAMAVLVGAVLAAEGVDDGVERGNPWPAVAATSVAFLAILPLDLAQRAYDQASVSDSPEVQARLLRRAVDLDPGFPLYQARLAWWEADKAVDDPESLPWSARRARQAAESALGVGPLWLKAGVLGQVNGMGWSRGALLRACQASPFSPFAPFHLATAGRRDALRDVWVARALLAEPRLLAARAWADEPVLLQAAVDRVKTIQGVDAGWREALGYTADRVRRRRGQGIRLTLTMDSDPALSLSLHTFRRRPWSTRLAEVPLWQNAVERIRMGPVTEMPSTEASVFQAPLCGLGTGTVRIGQSRGRGQAFSGVEDFSDRRGVE